MWSKSQYCCENQKPENVTQKPEQIAKIPPNCAFTMTEEQVTTGSWLSNKEQVSPTSKVHRGLSTERTVNFLAGNWFKQQFHYISLAFYLQSK